MLETWGSISDLFVSKLKVDRACLLFPFRYFLMSFRVPGLCSLLNVVFLVVSRKMPSEPP